MKAVKRASSRRAPIRQGGSPPLSRAAWISVALCIACAVLAFWVDGVSRFAFVEKISRLSFAEAPAGSRPVIAGTREEPLVLPYSSMDARWWVLHTEDMLRRGTWRIRETNLDNAPDGREVHWSSLLMWVLGGAAWMQSLGSGHPALDYVAEAAMCAGPILFTAFLLGLGILVARRHGVFPALFFAMVILTSYPLVRTFLTGEADHHGIVVGFAMGSVFSLLAGGCGLARKAGSRSDPDEEALRDLAAAKRWFAAGGILGAAALWISAATAVPIIAGSGFGGWLAGLLQTRGARRNLLRPELWTIWGAAGCLASIAFYVLEYFPDRMGWRLEVNHPLYAVAWLGGGVFLSTTLAAALRGNLKAADLAVSSAALAAAVAPAVVIVLFPGTFWVSDRFLLALHKEFILEFQSIATISRLAGSGWSWVSFYPWPLAGLAGAGVLMVKRRLGDDAIRGLLLLAPPILVTQALTVLQVRWGSAAFAMWSLAVLVVLVDLVAGDRSDRCRRWVFRSLLACGWIAMAVTILPQTAIRAEEERTCLDPPLPKEIAGNLLLRDISHRLIQADGDRIPVVLTGPNASTEMSYHAGVRTLGTLYWENMPGLKRAAGIFSVPDEAGALKALQDAGVTHIVIPSWDNFAESYAKLLAESEGRTSAEAPFFKAIVEGDECPQWLRPFAYPIPTNAGLDTRSVKIFAVLPGQSPFESAYYQGVYFFESGRMDRAREKFSAAQELRPTDERPGRYLAEIRSRESR